MPWCCFFALIARLSPWAANRAACCQTKPGWGVGSGGRRVCALSCKRHTVGHAAIAHQTRLVLLKPYQHGAGGQEGQKRSSSFNRAPEWLKPECCAENSELLVHRRVLRPQQNAIADLQVGAALLSRLPVHAAQHVTHEPWLAIWMPSASPGQPPRLVCCDVWMVLTGLCRVCTRPPSTLSRPSSPRLRGSSGGFPPHPTAPPCRPLRPVQYVGSRRPAGA